MIYTEFDPLQEVIVGDCYDPGDLDWALPKDTVDGFNKILEETKEDLNNLSDFLVKSNIKVHRPEVIKYKKEFDLVNFKVNFPICPIVPRDQYIVIGDTILQTYTSYTDRYFDSLSYSKIFTQLFKEGYNWLSSPPPILKDLNNIDNWYTRKDIYSDLLKEQLLFHTAVMFKAGDSVIYNGAGPGSKRGLNWVKRNLPDIRFIENEGTITDNYGHIDHGFILINDETVIHNNIDWVPLCLRNKNLIDIGKYLPPLNFEKYVNEYKQTGGKYSKSYLESYLNNWRGFSQEVCFDLNVLILDSNNILFNREIPELFKYLKTLNINSHCIPQRHSLYWEGGVHCLTLDIKRKGIKRRIIS
jgi:N-dimethylarginine dimethylaminohydrolase